MAPPQAQWRKGEALDALKRYPEAVMAFAAGREAAPPVDVKTFDQRLWRAVQRLTREQLAEVITVWTIVLSDGHLWTL
jgi:hypothetical protein